MTLASAASSTSSMGRSAVRMLGNAQATFGAGDPVEGIFKRRSADASLGGAGMAARDVSFQCCPEDLPAGVGQGAPLILFWGDQLVTPEGHYLVMRRVDNFETGLTTLVLEVNLRPAA